MADALCFVRLWGGLPLTTSTTRRPRLTVAVTYLDGTDDFDIYLDTSTGAQIPSCQTPTHAVSGTGTNRWITVEFATADGYFGRRCQSKVGGADIVLRSTSSSAGGAIVHAIEVYDPSKLP